MELRRVASGFARVSHLSPVVVPDGRVFSHSSRTDMWMVHKVFLLGASLYLSRWRSFCDTCLEIERPRTGSNQLCALGYLLRHHEISKGLNEDFP